MVRGGSHERRRKERREMLGEWGEVMAAAERIEATVVDMERGVVRNAAERIARASFCIEFCLFFVDLDSVSPLYFFPWICFTV